MIRSAVARTPILAFILMFFALGYTVAHNKVVIVPLGGEAAAPGISGYEVVINSQSINPSVTTLEGVTTQCPSGKRALGGGGITSENLRMVNSYPFGSGTAWRVTWAKRDGVAASPVNATVRVVCADIIS